MERIMQWLFNHAKATEWQTHHAAEDRYCSYCAAESDDWRSMDEHHPGCEYVRMMANAKNLLELWGG